MKYVICNIFKMLYELQLYWEPAFNLCSEKVDSWSYTKSILLKFCEYRIH